MRGSCVIFSSNTDNGLNAGRFYLNADYVASDAFASIGSGDLLHNYSTTSPCRSKAEQITMLRYVLVE